MRTLLLALILIVPGVGPTKYCYFLLDFSGSMSQKDKEKMIGYFKYCIQSYTDDGYIKLAIFDTECIAYSKKWIKLPNAHEYKKMLNWLSNIDRDGATDIANAISVALNEKKNELSVFTVTDGEHNTGTWDRVYEAQKKREYPAPLIFLTFGKNRKLISLSKKYGGKLLEER